jgi:hypothetical protein
MARGGVRVAALLVASCVLLAACSSTTASTTLTRLASAPGVTPTSVLLASEVPTGARSEVAAMRAVLAEVNSHGGILGRRVALLARDDQSDPATAAALTSDLDTTVGAFALVGDAPSQVVTPISIEAHASGIIQLFPLESALGPNTLNLVPPYVTQYDEIVQALTSLGLMAGRIAVVAPAGTPQSALATPIARLASGVEVLDWTPELVVSGRGQLAHEVPDLVVVLGPPPVALTVMRQLGADHESPIVVVAENSLGRAALSREAGAAQPRRLLRFASILPPSVLGATWQHVAARLAGGSLLGWDGAVSMMLATETIAAVGVNPTRREVLTDAEAGKLRLVAPELGAWTPSGGFEGGVLLGGTHPVYVSGQVVEPTPPTFPAPPRDLLRGG